MTKSVSWFVLLAGGLVAATSAQGAAQQPRNFVAAEYSHTAFQGGEAWELASLGLGRRTAAGPVIGRLNYAERFGTRGMQVEADAWPRLGKRMYAYLNLGYSRADVFPGWRSGGELYANLPHAWEASAGYRQLRFGGAPVTLLTGTVGKYTGNYWLSARPFVRMTGDGPELSGALTGRRYFAGADDYLGARVGAGSTPSDRLTPSELARTSTASAALQGSHTLVPRLVGTWAASLDRERLPLGTTRRRWELIGGLRVDY